jgi:hypothetical protein
MMYSSIWRWVRAISTTAVLAGVVAGDIWLWRLVA